MRDEEAEEYGERGSCSFSSTISTLTMATACAGETRAGNKGGSAEDGGEQGQLASAPTRRNA